MRTACAWVCKEQLSEILERKPINVVRAMLVRWCACVMRSKGEPMKEVAALVRGHLEGIVAWAQTRQTNGFLQAINGLFQTAKRRARGFGRRSTIKTVIFLIAGKLDFHSINPHARQPTWNSIEPNKETTTVRPELSSELGLAGDTGCTLASQPVQQSRPSP